MQIYFKKYSRPFLSVDSNNLFSKTVLSHSRLWVPNLRAKMLLVILYEWGFVQQQDEER